MILKQGHTGKDALQVPVAAFGKHPAWSDFVEIGIREERLASAWKALLPNGIVRLTEEGRWQALDENGQSIPFGHFIAWKRPESVLAGRIWPSSDSRGRKLYPLIVMVALPPGEFSRCPGLVASALAQAEPRWRGATEPAALESALADMETQIAQELAAQHMSPPPLGRPASRLVQCPQVGEEELLRLIYHVERDGGAAADPTKQMRFRVPRCTMDPAEASALWADFALWEFGEKTEVLCMAPMDEDWLDVNVGAVNAESLFALRASKEAVPLTTLIPYTLAENFVQHAKGRIEALREGRGAAQTPQQGVWGSIKKLFTE